MSRPSKYKGLRVAALMFERNEYLFKFDLKSGYHHVDIHPECYKFLGEGGRRFSVEGVFYVFTVLPFRLSSACYLFTKLLRPLIRLWKGRGLKAIIYLDDGIVTVRGKERAIRESASVKRHLESAGFVVNIEKSQWDPSHSMEWLGFLINLSKGEFSVPNDKIDKLLELKTAKSAGTKQIASITGSLLQQLMSMWTGKGAKRISLSIISLSLQIVLILNA